MSAYGVLMRTCKRRGSIEPFGGRFVELSRKLLFVPAE